MRLGGLAFTEWAAVQRAQAIPIDRQGQKLGPVLLGVERLTSGHRPDEKAVFVLVFGDLARFPAVDPRRWLSVPVGEFYSAEIARFALEAAREKGMSTSLVFSAHAAQASSWYW